jgi:hypothetical protein
MPLAAGDKLLVAFLKVLVDAHGGVALSNDEAFASDKDEDSDLGVLGRKGVLPCWIGRM